MPHRPGRATTTRGLLLRRVDARPSCPNQYQTPLPARSPTIDEYRPREAVVQMVGLELPATQRPGPTAMRRYPTPCDTPDIRSSTRPPSSNTPDTASPWNLQPPSGIDDDRNHRHGIATFNRAKYRTRSAPTRPGLPRPHRDVPEEDPGCNRARRRLGKPTDDACSTLHSRCKSMIELSPPPRRGGTPGRTSNRIGRHSVEMFLDRLFRGFDRVADRMILTYVAPRAFPDQ